MFLTRRQKEADMNLMQLQYMKTSWHSPDCASCMMIETGEKASHPGQRCDSCGRFPRSIGGY